MAPDFFGSPFFAFRRFTLFFALALWCADIVVTGINIHLVADCVRLLPTTLHHSWCLFGGSLHWRILFGTLLCGTMTFCLLLRILLLDLGIA
jgi:hypothetical protein